MADKAKTVLVAVAFIAIIIASGYLWRQADRAATDRSAWLGELAASEDTAVGFSASGFEDRTVTISAYTLGTEDKTEEDAWLETLSHEKAEALYSRGFRRVTVSGGAISRTISVTPDRSASGFPNQSRISIARCLTTGAFVALAE